MRNIKKQLKRDIDKSAKYDFDAVKEKCNINTEPRSTTLALNNGEQRTARTLNVTFIILLSFLLLALGVFMLLKDKNGGASPKHQFVIVDINPSLEIEYDENGKVVSARAYNEDAEIVLCDLDLENLPYSDAISVVFDRCVELGYLSVERDDNAIMISVVNEDGSKNEEMTSTIKDKFANEFSSKRILGVVITGVVDSTLQPEADKYGIDVQKYAYIKEYTDMGGVLDTDEYKNISIRQIRTMIYEKEKEAKSELVSYKKNQADALKSTLELAIPQMIQSTTSLVEARINILKLSYEDKSEIISKYEALLDELNQPQGESFADYIKSFVSTLASIIAVESDESINALCLEFIAEFEEISELFASLDELNKSHKEKAQDRKDSLGEVPSGSATDVDKWQSEKEDDISKNWFDHKDKWQQGQGAQKNEQVPNNGPNQSPSVEQIPNQPDEGLQRPNKFPN